MNTKKKLNLKNKKIVMCPCSEELKKYDYLLREYLYFVFGKYAETALITDLSELSHFLPVKELYTENCKNGEKKYLTDMQKIQDKSLKFGIDIYKWKCKPILEVIKQILQHLVNTITISQFTKKVISGEQGEFALFDFPYLKRTFVGCKFECGKLTMCLFARNKIKAIKKAE